MYRTPASHDGAAPIILIERLFLMLTLTIWTALFVTGCTDLPTDPGFDDMPSMGDVEVEMATDPDLTASLIEDVTSSMTANMTTTAATEISRI